MTTCKNLCLAFLVNVLIAMPGVSKIIPKNDESQTILLKNLPKVTLLVKEQYVDPSRINPDAMFASILEALELKITKLVVTLPKSLENILEQMRTVKGEVQTPKTAELTKAAESKKAVEPKKTEKGKEKLVLDLGGTTKTFDYESPRSIWGMIFSLRDIFKFVEAEANKQGLTNVTGDEAIDWEKIETAAINGMLSTLDPHSVWLEPKYARDLTLTTKGEFGGIGIVISVRDGFLTVISSIDGTPAYKAGVKAKDRIIKIDDDSAINMDLNDAVNLLRGKPNTPVRVTVQRAGSAKETEYVLKRAIIKVDSVAYALVNDDIGYLRVKAFQGNTAADVKNGILAMKKLSKEKMTGLILDLRGNPGGLLREAVEISDLFLDGKEVVSTQGSRADSRQVEMASPGELDPKLKIVVLADVGSASASEIVAGALKNDRGIVIGDRTFGKGSVQILFDFPNEAKDPNKKVSGKPEPVEPAALKLTIAEYFAPNHTSMQNIGVTPDIQLSPVYAEKAEELSLFPEVSQREVDLEGHLAPEASNKKVLEESLVNLEYLAPKADEEAGEYNKLDLKKLKDDFYVSVASEFIKESNGVSRKDLLANAQTIKNKISQKEHKKIEEALKKYNIDWSEGERAKNPSIKATIIENRGATSGNKLKVSVKVKNTGKEPLYQVHALTHAKTDLFNLKEFLFGKIMPGQEIERAVEFEIPKDVITRKDMMTLEFRDIKREKIDEMVVPLQITGLGRPRLAHRFFIDDASGNGAVQQNEDVELVVWLKNVGDGRAFEPTVLLRNESGSAVFLKNGRAQSGELLPNHETSMKFSFRVKEPVDQAKFEIQVFDGKMHDLWRDKIVLAVSNKKKASSIKRSVMVKGETAALLSDPASSGEKIATVKTGLKLSAIREHGDYLQVNVDKNLSGFIKKSEVKDAPKDKTTKAINKSEYYSINYNRVPPRVALKFGDNSGWSKVASGMVEAKIDNDDKVSDVLLYINGKKVLYRDIKGHGKDKIEQQINLKPGVNSISIFVRKDATYGQRENITVYFDSDGKALDALKSSVKSAEK